MDKYKECHIIVYKIIFHIVGHKTIIVLYFFSPVINDSK